MTKKPAIKEEARYRYRLRHGFNGVLRVDALVQKRNGWWVIGFDRKNKRSVEVQPGAVFPLNTGITDVQYGAPHKWPALGV
jgi:hypothetical protein